MESYQKPLVICFCRSRLPAQEVRLCRPGVCVIHIQDHKFHVAVIKGVDSRAHIAAGRRDGDVAAETVVVMVPLGDSKQMVPQKGLARRGIDTAALKQ